MLTKTSRLSYIVRYCGRCRGFLQPIRIISMRATQSEMCCDSFGIVCVLASGLMR